MRPAATAPGSAAATSRSAALYTQSATAINPESDHESGHAAPGAALNRDRFMRRSSATGLFLMRGCG